MLMKACGSATWGPVDIFSVKFSEMPSMQGLGDATFTMGLIFSAVGLGCTLGPFVFNPFTAPTKASLTAAVAASLACLAVGYWAMLQATNVYTMILAQTVRAMGSAVLWIDSSLLLQLRVPNAVLGRVAALELAAYTVAEGTSSLLGGLSFDALHWTLHQSVLAVAVLATGIAAAWAVIAHGTWRAARAAAYKPLADRDEVGERGLEAGLELATRQL
ncbi:hypothetical protein H632_c794p1 [Helicosporidium sp. ATCC 50920]|nr:hypothetical protein H632_c794p1 [Helicosporidium sp. ATCC 50920]|eukprot:KDD75234.1 hypothetical protein H632_c794p1 [Helicosporidium sp. ATCC 50920]